MLKSHKIDLLHSSEPIQGAIGGLACRAMAASKCIYHRHHASDIEAQNFSRVAALTSDATMAVSEAAANHALHHDIFNKRKVYVANKGATDLRAFSEREVRQLRQRLRISNGDWTFVSVAHLRPEKGHRYLIQSIELIRRKNREPVHLIIVGDGPERVTLARSVGPDHSNIHFVGEQSDMAPWYALADAVVVPSVSESFGLTAIEGMAASKPIIATRVGGLAEIVRNEESGLLVIPFDSAALADGMLKLLREPEKAKEYGRKGRSIYLSSFMIDHMVSRWIQAYEDALAGTSQEHS